MRTKSILLILLLAFTFSVSSKNESFAGHYDQVETDNAQFSLYSFIDLRDRETFVQVTNTDSTQRVLHVQIFNVDNDCNENNFFDTYTPNDTHVYNMRDIQTNDGNPSGILLPENAYGFVVISIVDSELVIDTSEDFLIGNFRILDNSGYEYRGNSAGPTGTDQPSNELWFFNFNSDAGVILSDVVFVIVDAANSFSTSSPAVEAANLVDANWAFDVDIFNLDEVPFSCRNVIYACVDQDNPRLEELLEDNGDASVASFEYGINEVIPHSRGGELLCPGNTISDGWVLLNTQNGNLTDDGDYAASFVGLNNGNGRGTIDTMFQENNEN